MLKPISNFANHLITWHKKYGRKDLPWQKNKTPYRVWISEVMLQQTQVTTVIPYFEKFMRKFPTTKSLANAKLDDVLVLWAGLGYYSRAKNLHKAAQIIKNDFRGTFPNNLEELQELPGIGRSTAGAILSFAFKKPTAILDGNVKRIFIRFHGIRVSMNDTKAQKTLWKIAENYLPQKNIVAYIQDLMDPGATLCTRNKPKCHECPFQKNCEAYQTDKTKTLPLKIKRKILPIRKSYFLILQDQVQKILLVKRPPIGIWSNLWSLPEIKKLNKLELILNQYHLKMISQKKLSPFRHTFSHFHLDITPIMLHVRSKSMIMENDQTTWINANNVRQFGLPKPVSDLLKTYL